jgi:hypothetical protein
MSIHVYDDVPLPSADDDFTTHVQIEFRCANG